MKNALNRLQQRLRHRSYLHQARSAIARCERNVARRRRIGVPVATAPRAHYFAPGVIEGGPRPRRGLRSYLFTLVVALASGAFFLLRAGFAS